MTSRHLLFALVAAGALGLAACESDSVAPAAADQNAGIDPSGHSNSTASPSPGAPGRDTTARDINRPDAAPESPPVHQ